MVSFDINSYHSLFIKNAKDCLNSLKANLISFSSTGFQQKTVNIFEMYRLVHMLKSQSGFMGYQNTAQYCLLLEKIFKQIKEKNIPLNSNQINDINQALDVLTKDLDQINQQKKEIELIDKIDQLNQIYKNQYETVNS